MKMKRIYLKKSVISVSYDNENNLIILNWKSFRISLEDIKDMHREILDFAVKNDCQVYIADTSATISVLSDKIISWWRETWIPELIKNNIKMIITVLPRNIMAQMSTFEWQKGDYGEIRMYNVISMDQAKKIALENV